MSCGSQAINRTTDLQTRKLTCKYSIDSRTITLYLPEEFDVETAQETADGKIVTFFQATEPAGSESAIGDLWLDTDDKNKAYRYDGSTWQLIRDTDIPQAITDAATAQGAADDAQGDATTALNTLSDIAADNKITPVEKLTLKPLWDAIVAEATLTTGTLPIQAAAFSVDDSAFDSAYATLYAYIVTSLGTFDSMSTTTDITRATWDTDFEAYYDARTDLLNAIATAAKDLADTAQGTAEAAQGAADDAQGDATTALNSLSDIAADTKITPVEKLTAKQLWDAIVVEGTATTGTIPVQALALGVADTDFDTVYAALNTYLNTTTEVFANMATTTTVVRATWDTAWKNYYDERTQLLNEIAAKTATLAVWATVSGADKPADNADVTGDNPQGIAWIDETVGSELPVDNTAAKCTDPNADETSAAPEFGGYLAGVVAGDYLEIAGDAQVYKDSATPFKMKEIVLGRKGTYRIKFNLWAFWPGENYVYGRIYKNGNALGTTRSNWLDAPGTQYSEDLAFEAHDLCQLYLWHDGVENNRSYANNFRVYSGNPVVNIVSL